MPAERKWNLIFSGAALAVVAAGLWQAYAPYAGRMGDVQAIRSSITPIEPGELAARLKKKPHPPTLLFVYASWCSSCARVMPHLAGIIREHEHDGVRFLFVSIDKEKTELTDYLIRNRYDGLFTPYILPHVAGLPPALASVGAYYPGGIPYLAFFDKRGKLAREISGAPARDEILAALKEIR